MDKLLKLEKYQLLHNSIYWCGMIGIFILGFLQQILMLQRSWDRQKKLLLLLLIFLMEWCMILRFFLSSCRLYLH